MADVLKDVPPWALTLIILILLWVAKESWESRKESSKKHEKALENNTHALIALQVELKNLKDTLEGFHKRVGNLEDDVDALHKLRRQEQ